MIMNHRWMVRRDMPEVLEIESHSFEFPWSEDDFIRCLRQRSSIGYVTEFDERVIGYMIYELLKPKLQLLSMAVHKDFRRRGVGGAMLNKLKSKLSPLRRSRLVTEVRETNLIAQQFFAANEFHAVSIQRNFYEDTPEDAYVFMYRVREESKVAAVEAQS